MFAMHILGESSNELNKIFFSIHSFPIKYDAAIACPFDKLTCFPAAGRPGFEAAIYKFQETLLNAIVIVPCLTLIFNETVKVLGVSADQGCTTTMIPL